MNAPVGDDVRSAAQRLCGGELVAFATETVYGLGVNALDETAVAKVFAAKNRPTFDPLIVHLHDVSQLQDVVAELPAAARKLIDAFWPGPLTLVLPKRDVVPDLVTAGLQTVAVRMPDHPQALELLRLAGVPVAAPSANPFGCISPTTAAHVAEQLGDAVDYILDGGPCRVGLESTVLQIRGDGDASFPDARGRAEAVVLRPGGLTLEAIEAVVGPVAFPASTGDASAKPAPGMLSRHYAPQTPLDVAASLPVPQPGERVGLLTLSPPADATGFEYVEALSPTGDLVEAAAGFFAALRRLDAMRLDRIVATVFPEQGLGRALNDRLQRAARRR